MTMPPATPFRLPAISALGSLVLLALVHHHASAHNGATGIVKERMDLMASVEDAMKELAARFRGAKPYDADLTRRLAARIADHGGERMLTKFPEGSIHGPSEARVEIWRDWDRFADLSREMTHRAEALGKAADNPRLPETEASDAALKGEALSGASSVDPYFLGVEEVAAETALSTLAPERIFVQLALTCSACHRDYRQAK